MPPILPAQFDIFATEVVPLLRKRSLFRSEYRDGTLRDRLGLDAVQSRFNAAAPAKRSA